MAAFTKMENYMKHINGPTITQLRLWQVALADNPHPRDPWWRKVLRRIAQLVARYVW